MGRFSIVFTSGNGLWVPETCGTDHTEGAWP